MSTIPGKHMEARQDAGACNSDCQCPSDDSIINNKPAYSSQAAEEPSNPINEQSSASDTSGGCRKRWFDKPVYRRYWKHYQFAQDWFKRHNSVVHKLNCLSIHEQAHSPFTYSLMLSQWSRYYYDLAMRQYGMYGMYHDYSDYRDYYNDEHEDYEEPAPNMPGTSSQWKDSDFKKPNPVAKQPNRKRKDQKGRHKPSQKKRRQNSVSSGKSNVSSSESQELFEMEITGEMMEFFVKSAQHKKEMAAIKKQKKEEEKETGDYIPLNKATSGRTNPRTSRAPTERPGVRRTTEMKLLYGEGAAMIHGMETAMQLNYDRHFDIQQPKLWPNLPINIKF